MSKSLSEPQDRLFNFVRLISVAGEKYLRLVDWSETFPGKITMSELQETCDTAVKQGREGRGGHKNRDNKSICIELTLLLTGYARLGCISVILNISH